MTPTDWLAEAVRHGWNKAVECEDEYNEPCPYGDDNLEHVIASVRQAFLDQIVGPMAGLEEAIRQEWRRQRGITRSGDLVKVETAICQEYVETVRRWLRAQVGAERDEGGAMKKAAKVNEQETMAEQMRTRAAHLVERRCPKYDNPVHELEACRHRDLAETIRALPLTEEKP